jgi:exonuclease III
VRNAGAKLALPPGTVIRDIYSDRNAQKTTINLVFITETLTSQIYKYKIANELEYGSDHLPISTKLK